VTGPVAVALWVGLSAVGTLGALTACGPDPSGSVGPASPASAAGPASSMAAPTSGAGSSVSAAPALVPGSLLHAPLDCPAGIGVLVLQRLAVALDHPFTAVVARCDSGAGSPPSGVYLVSGDGAVARVVQTLVGPGQELQVSALTTTATGITVVAAGYSRPDVPRCCPDVTVTLTWRALGDRLVPVP
jgi:hypothetical protein